MGEAVLKANPLGTEKISKLIIKYAIPSIISFVVNSIYNIVDQIFIGQGVSYLGNAATNMIMPLATIVIAIGVMLGDGAATYMSLNLGRKEPEKAAKGVGTMIPVSILFGIIMMILMTIFLEPLCYLFGATQGTIPYAMDYGRIIVAGFPFSIVCLSFSSTLRADGRPKQAMIGLLIGCITNIILDYVFVMVLAWGVKGAALATIIGQALNAIYFVFCMFRFKTIKIKKEMLKPSKKILVRILSLGVSSCITQSAIVVVIAVLNNLLVKYGGLSVYGADIPLATFGITMKVNMLSFGIVMGLATSSQPILGYNYGSKQFDRVKKTFKTTLVLGIIISSVAFALFQLIPGQIVSLFGQESDLYMEFAVRCMKTYLMLCMLPPVTASIGIFFQAIGKPMNATIISLSRQILFMIPTMLTLSALWGIDGLLYTGPVADTISAVFAVIVLLVSWKKIFKDEKTLPKAA